MRYLIQAQHALQQKYPLVYFHIQSGDRKDILDSLDQGLSDFGLILGEVDTAKYDCLDIPCRNTWGVLMRRDSPLAEKAAVEPRGSLEQAAHPFPPGMLCRGPAALAEAGVGAN